MANKPVQTVFSVFLFSEEIINESFNKTIT